MQKNWLFFPLTRWLAWLAGCHIRQSLRIIVIIIIIIPKPDQNIPLWSQKWLGNMLNNTRLQRNGRPSPKSDNNMNYGLTKTGSQSRKNNLVSAGGLRFGCAAIRIEFVWLEITHCIRPLVRKTFALRCGDYFQTWWCLKWNMFAMTYLTKQDRSHVSQAL